MSETVSNSPEMVRMTKPTAMRVLGFLQLMGGELLFRVMMDELNADVLEAARTTERKQFSERIDALTKELESRAAVSVPEPLPEPRHKK